MTLKDIMMKQGPTLPACAALLLAGCVAAPPVPSRPVPITAPATFQAAAAQGRPQGDATAWWTTWQDPALDRLVEQALQANPDLRSARAHVAAARALSAVAEGALYPSITAQGTVWTGWSDQAIDPPLGTQFAPFGTGSNQQARALALGAQWEPDLFGGRNASALAARAAADVATDLALGLQVVVAGDVVENYQQLQGLKQRLVLLDRSVADARALVDYSAARMAAGQAGAADVAKARTLLDQTEALRGPLLALIEVRYQRLAVLAGLTPQQRVTVSNAGLLAVPAPPAGQLPSQVLERRPDVRARLAMVRVRAERLKSLKADLLPRFGIAFVGQSGRVELTGLPGYGGNAALVGLSASVPLFTAGRLRARVAAGDAELTAALADQDKALLAALEQVEAAYAMRRAFDEKLEGLTRATGQAAERARLLQGLYTAGRATKSDVLQARLAECEAQDAIVQTRMAQASATVQLARALGGGWPDRLHLPAR